MLDLLEAAILWRVVWRSATTTSGVLSVMTYGARLTQEWSADNLDTPPQVSEQLVTKVHAVYVCTGVSKCIMHCYIRCHRLL